MARTGDLKHVLAVRPSEFSVWTEQFVIACQFLADGDVGSARRALGEFDGLAVTHWFHFSAQNEGYDRVVLLGNASSRSTAISSARRSAERMPGSETTHRTYARDRFRCRYCQSPVLPPRVLRNFSEAVGIDLQKKRTNLETHGVQWLHCASIDHIAPHASGGDSTVDNLATSCKACQFGKGKYSLEELDLTLRGPAPDLRVRRRSWVETVAALSSRID